jgi:hypothetical protein
MGSHARGEAHRLSDLDLLAVGPGLELGVVRRGGHLVVGGCQTAEQVRAGFKSPAEAGFVVPGWRSALMLHDPRGLGAALRAEALAWSWEVVGERACDGHVARAVTGLAEEVHKLVGSLELGETWTAAVQRSVLALRLASILAVHHRLLYETENGLWELVAGRMGAGWARAQGVALGAGGESFEDTCAAALELYARAAEEVAGLLSAEQRDVVGYACAVASQSLPGDHWTPLTEP